MTTAHEKLTKVLRALAALRDAEAAFLDKKDPFDQTEAIQTALAKITGDTEVDFARRNEIIFLLGKMKGRVSFSALLGLLANPHPETRTAVGNTLIERANEDLDAFLVVVEATIDGVKRANTHTRHDQICEALPSILAEIGSKKVAVPCRRLLRHRNERVVFEAISALIYLGDKASLPDLTTLKQDERMVNIGSEDKPKFMTIGQLAKEAIDNIAS